MKKKGADISSQNIFLHDTLTQYLMILSLTSKKFIDACF